MRYHGRNFKIFDTEKNHSLIDSAPFHIPQNDGDAWSWSTACQRGYTAEYIIREDGSLWGRKFITVPGDTPYSRKKVGSDQIRTSYTGSCVIAYAPEDGEFRICDMLEAFLYYPEAHEIHFLNGILDEDIDLQQIITEYRSMSAQMFEEEKRSYNWRDEFVRPRLKYKYGLGTYHWGDGPEQMRAAIENFVKLRDEGKL